MSSPAGPELVRWYTRARKFPQLIGRTPDGAKIWGGPYTFTQAIGAGVIGLVAVNTMGLWANYGFVGNTLVLVAVTYGGVLLLGRIPVGSRSPVSFVAGSVHAVIAPRGGRFAGRPVRLRRPHVVRHRVTVALDPLPSSPRPARHLPAVAKARISQPAATDPPASKPPAAAPKPGLTGVQSLLAQGRIPPNERH